MRDDLGQTNSPPSNTDFVAISASGHNLALKADGSITAWGYCPFGACLVPAPNTDFVAIAAHNQYSLGLKGDGSIVGWGRAETGQTNVPIPNADFTAISAGLYHSVGIQGYAHGDLDHDADADLDDFSILVDCLDGPVIPPPPGCDEADIDDNGHADLLDFAQFQTIFSGPR